MAVKNLQVIIGAGVTPFIPSGSIRCNWMTCQDNGAHAMAVGGPDTAVGTPGVGLQLSVGASNHTDRPYCAQTNLAFWYVAGTEGEALNVVYDDGVDDLP